MRASEAGFEPTQTATLLRSSWDTCPHAWFIPRRILEFLTCLLLDRRRRKLWPKQPIQASDRCVGCCVPSEHGFA